MYCSSSQRRLDWTWLSVSGSGGARVQWSLGFVTPVRIVAVSERSVAVEHYQPVSVPPDLYGRWQPQKDSKQQSGVLTDWQDTRALVVQFEGVLVQGHLPEAMKATLA